MISPKGADPQRLMKGDAHKVTPVTESTDKPGFVKPGGGRNRREKGMDSMPEFVGLTSYRSTRPTPPATDHGQDVYPPADKTAGPSIGGK